MHQAQGYASLDKVQRYASLTKPALCRLCCFRVWMNVEEVFRRLVLELAGQEAIASIVQSASCSAASILEKLYPPGPQRVLKNYNGLLTAAVETTRSAACDTGRQLTMFTSDQLRLPWVRRNSCASDGGRAGFFDSSSNASHSRFA